LFRNTNVELFENHIWLASPTMHEEEQEYIKEAFQKNWITTAGNNINELEKSVAVYLSSSGSSALSHAMELEKSRTGAEDNLYCVALSTGTAAIHLALKLAALETNPGARFSDGLLRGKRIFVSDLTFNATVNPILYEGGEPVFIDSEYETWNMDPDALSRAFELFPDVKIVVAVNLYGTPAQLLRIKRICEEHGALLIEDAAESFGATIDFSLPCSIGQDECNGHGSREVGKVEKLGSREIKETATIGDLGVLSFNGNKIITGSAGGMIVVHSKEDADRIRKWSTQAREDATWYQHEELGYNYRMSNVVAGIVRGQMIYLDEHIQRKRDIWERYRYGLKDLPVRMNPIITVDNPNYWLSCMTIDKDAMAPQVRSEREALFVPTPGKTCPTEVLKVLSGHNAEGRPIWKPLHLEPLYRGNVFISRDGDSRARTDAYIEHRVKVVDEDVFERGVCLPSDIKMTVEEQERVIDIVKDCFE